MTSTRCWSSTKVTAADTDECVDVGASTLMPGLIDAHVHLAFDSDTADPLRGVNRSADELLSTQRSNARRALLQGTTTVRDLGDKDFSTLGLAREAASADSGLPLILTAGPPITRPGGHCWFLGGEVNSAADIADAVTERHSRGVDFIKIMASGGHITSGSSPDGSQFSRAELDAVVTAAATVGLEVIAHAHGVTAIRDSVLAGVRGIEHLSFMADLSTVEVDWDVVDQLVSAGIQVGITAGRRDDSSAEIPKLIQAVRAPWARLAQLGVSIVCCSDAGIGPNRPHGVLRTGLAGFAHYTQLGNAEVLRSVTTTAARHCGLDHRKGRLAPGFDADIIAVGPNLATDLGALDQLNLVLREGIPTITAPTHQPPDQTSPATH